MRVALLPATLLMIACHAVAAETAPPRTISANGEAVVHVVPDEVVLALGVETFAPKLEDAKKANDERATRLVRTIKSAGVEERHVQTDVLTLEIRYRSSHPSEGIEGYYARRAYSVTLKEPKKLEALLDAALTSGANQILGISYRTTELRKHRDQARQMAIKAAKEKAVALAAALECTVGAPRSISEGHSGYQPWYGRFNAMAQNSMQVAGPGSSIPRWGRRRRRADPLRPDRGQRQRERHLRPVAEMKPALRAGVTNGDENEAGPATRRAGPAGSPLNRHSGEATPCRRSFPPASCGDSRSRGGSPRGRRPGT